MLIEVDLVQYNRLIWSTSKSEREINVWCLFVKALAETQTEWHRDKNIKFRGNRKWSNKTETIKSYNTTVFLAELCEIIPELPRNARWRRPEAYQITCNDILTNYLLFILFSMSLLSFYRLHTVAPAHRVLAKCPEWLSHRFCDRQNSYGRWHRLIHWNIKVTQPDFACSGFPVGKTPFL